MIDFVGIIYALIVSAGGIVGYVKAGSIPSIVAGLTFGVLIGISAYFCSIDPPKPLFQIIVALVLGCFMGFRWVKGGKFMPAGLITVLSVAVLIWAVAFYFKHLPFVGNSGEQLRSDEENVTEQN
ncbi:transmembrane protein 14 homolog [Culicoides brevitarsis]|uniref:transmembrane protein 14 homolog n=1 Tax=Culicoides brevitarsis TaxID=469753 RepID=UPI00307B66EE